MKRLFLFTISAILLTLSVSAQPRMTSTERAKQITKQLTRELSLDTKQQKKVEKIYVTYFDAMQASRPAIHRPMGRPNGGGMREGMPRGERPNMGGGQRPQMNGQRPPMDERPDMEVVKKEMDKAADKCDKSMKKALNDTQYARWKRFERERLNKDFKQMNERRGKGNQQRQHTQQRGR